MVVILLVAACSDDAPSRGEDGRLTSAGELSVFDLRSGDCLILDETLEPTNETLPVVPCEDEHQAEVYALVDVDDIDAYPGERELANRAEHECIREFPDYVGVDLVDSELFYTYMIPSIRSWQDDDDRTVVCIAMAAGRPLEGSVEGSGI